MDFLSSLGLGQDQICNMASISVVLLGLNPDTRLAPVVEYLKGRGVPADQVSKRRRVARGSVRCKLEGCASSCAAAPNDRQAISAVQQLNPPATLPLLGRECCRWGAWCCSTRAYLSTR